MHSEGHHLGDSAGLEAVNMAMLVGRGLGNSYAMG